MAFNNFKKVAALLYAVAFATLELCHGFGYSELSAMNATCPPKDTCKVLGKGPRLDESSNWKYRNCFCDDLCAQYGDCCLDANAYVAEKQIESINNYECVKLTQFGSLYMMGKCIQGWNDKGIAEQCTTSIEKGSDPFREMPVTSLETYVTYKNYYCAVCNNDTKSLELWKPRLECPTLEQYQKTHKNLTMAFVSKELVYEEMNWGLHVQDDRGSEFHKCYIYPVLPVTVTHIVRPCVKDLIKSCSSTWVDEEAKKLCLSYTAVRYKFDRPYRNIHCALCNDIDLESTFCINRVFFRDFFLDSFNNQSFALLFDFKDRRGGNIIGSITTCQLGEVFDPFFKKCRSVICGRSNQEYRLGRCVDIKLPKLVSAAPTTTPAAVLSTQLPTVNKTELLVSNDLEFTTLSPVDKHNNPANSSLETSVSRDFNSSYPLGFDRNISSINNGTWSAVASTETPSLNSTASTKDSTTESLLPGSNKGVESRRVPMDDIGENPGFTLVTNSTSNSSQPETTSDNGKAPAQFLPCEKFFLPNEEYTVGENGTVAVEKYKRTYEVNEYEVGEGGILVCIIQLETEKFSRIMGWVTLGGLGLSCVCLILHLIAFLIVPELRNLSGKNLASLCLVLLGAFSIFILSTFGEPGGSECFILAISMYYFFLSSFFWVNIMAFDVWRTLSLATTELRVSAGGQCCKFMVYAVYGWLFPAAAVIGVLLLDLIRPDFLPEQYYPAFGEYWCWFGHRKALLVFFAAPLMTIMVLNIILFILSARIIANTMDSTAKMTTCAPYHSQFKLYMRLALLMGLTWISGIVAGYLQVEAIWYIFVLLNTLQGVFIFLAFTCTRKVWHTVSCGCCRRIRKTRPWVCRSQSSSKQGLQSTNSNTSNLSQTIPSPQNFSART